MKRSWRQWLWKTLTSGSKRRTAGLSERRVRPSLEVLESRLVPVTPAVTSIVRTTPLGPITSAVSVAYTVNFNQTVTGVDATDFKIVTTGAAQATTPVAVSGSGSSYTVTVNGIHGSGDLRLDLIDNDSILGGGVPLGGTGVNNGSFQGQAYNILQTFPSALSINRTTPAGQSTSATSVNFTVTFSTGVTGVDLTDFQLALTGTAAATLGQVTPSGTSVYTVTISGITGAGTLGLNLVDNGSIRDLAGNPLTAPNPSAALQAQPTFATATQTTSMALGDVNGDGKLDLALADYSSSAVSVLLGNGNGTFAGRRTFTTGSNSRSVVLGDVNGDGKPDLTVANVNNVSVSVLLGNGNGTFQTHHTFGTGALPWALALGDVNGDGKPDLAVANFNSSVVSVLLGNGDGTFQLRQTFAAGALLTSVALGDVNGDGKSDLAIASGNGNTVSVLLGNGNGTFQAQQTFDTGSSPYAVALGDVSGDGQLDLAVTHQGTNTISVLVSNGNGTFQAHHTFATGSHPALVALGDVNGDGKLDLAVPSSGSSGTTVSVLLGNGNGTFQAQQTFGGGGASVAVGDVDGDGKLDLAIANETGTVFKVNVLLGNGKGGFTGQVYTIVAPARRFAVAAPEITTAGNPLVFTVTAQDESNNTVSSYTGTVQLTSTDAKAVLPPNSTLSNGVGTFGATLKTANIQMLTATDTASTSITGVSNDISVSPGALYQLFVEGNPGGFAGAIDNPYIFTVTAQDQFNNTVPNYSGTVRFTTSDSQITPPANAQLTDGVGTFSLIWKTAGTQTLTATDTVSNTVVGSKDDITVQPDKASHFGVVAPNAALMGYPFNLTVSALDAFNNIDSNYTGTVRFSSTDGAAVGLNSTTLANGAGTFSVTLKTAGNQTITANDNTNNLNGISSAITVSSAANARFIVTASAAPVAGVPLLFTVTAKDTFNNTVTAYSGTVHFTTSDSQAMPPANAILTNGVGTFGITLKTAGTQTLTAADTLNAALNGTSGSISVGAAAANHFTVAAPTSSTAGAPLVLFVTAQDPFNNTATVYSGTVHFSSSDSLANLPSNATLTAGTGTFTATLKTTGAQSLTASDAVSSSISGKADINVLPAGVVTHFSVIGIPSSITAGGPLLVSVTARDAANNLASGYSGTVHFTSTDGQAFFTDISLSGGTGITAANLRTAGSQTITATDTLTGTLSGTSAAILVTPAAVSHLAISAPAAAIIGIAFPFTVTARDLYNNTATSYAGTAHFSSTDGAAVLPANSTLTNGVGTFGATLKTTGNHTLFASDTATNISGICAGIVTRGLIVTTLTPTPTGFRVQFNTSFDAAAINLYNAFGDGAPDDVILSNGSGAPPVSLPGSLLIDSSNTSFTFIQTGGILAAGTYTVTLRSAANGFKDTSGGLLDGNNDGVAGDNFSTTFTIGSSTAPVLSIPDFARGPDTTATTAPGITTRTIRIPYNAGNAVQTINFAGSPTGGTFALTFKGITTAPITYSTVPSTLQSNIQDALNAAFSANTVLTRFNMFVAGGTASSITVSLQRDLGGAVQPTMTASGSFSGGSSPSVTVATITSGVNTGIPITLANATNVTDVTFKLNYTSALLNITSAFSNTAGTTLALLSASGGVASFSYHVSTPTSGTLTLGQLVANVPSSAASLYTSKELLHLSNIVLNGSVTTTLNDDAVHVVAYLGDTNGDGTLGSGDGSRYLRYFSGLDTNTATGTLQGFAAYRLLDPVIISDIRGGGLPAGNLTLLNRLLVSNTVGNAQAQIPPIPPGVTVTLPTPHPDPTLSLPTNVRALPGSAVVVPVNIDTARPEGSTGLLEAIVALRYNPQVFDISAADVRLGSLLPGRASDRPGGWQVTAAVDAATGAIGIDLFGTAPILTNAGGTLMTLIMHVRDTAPLGMSNLNLVPEVTVAGRVFQTMAADTQSTLLLHPAVTDGMDAGVDGQAVITPLPPPVAARVPDTPPANLTDDARNVSVIAANHPMLAMVWDDSFSHVEEALPHDSVSTWSNATDAFWDQAALWPVEEDVQTSTLAWLVQPGRQSRRQAVVELLEGETEPAELDGFY